MSDNEDSSGGSCCGSLMNMMVAIDIFGKRPQLRLPTGKTKYKTAFGCCCTLLYLIIVLGFGLLKGNEWRENKNRMTALTNTVQDQLDYFSEVGEIDPRAQVAFGLIDPTDPTWSLTASLGKISAKQRKWDFNPAEGDAEPVNFKDIASVDCTPEKLGMTGKIEDPEVPSTNFYPTADSNSKNSIDKFSNSMKCFDYMELVGNGQGMNGKQLVIQVEACKGASCIADVQTVRQLLKGKSIALFYNQKVLDEENFDQPYLTQAKFVYLPIATQVVENNILQFTMGVVQSSESFLRPFYDWNEQEESLFWMERGQSKFYSDSDSDVIAAVTIERNMNFHQNKLVLENSVVFWVGILGGFALVLYFILCELERCCTNSKFEHYLASELYMVDDGSVGSDTKGDDDQEEKSGGCCGGGGANLMTKRTMVTKDFNNGIFGRDDMVLDKSKKGMCQKIWGTIFCCCSKQGHVDKVFARAKKLSIQELNVTSIIKAQREAAALVQLAKEADIAKIEKAVKRVIDTLDEDADGTDKTQRVKQETNEDIENQKGDEAADKTKMDGDDSIQNAKLLGEGAAGTDRKKDSDTNDDDGDRKRSRSRPKRGGEKDTDRDRDRKKRRDKDDGEDGDRKKDRDRRGDRSKKRDDDGDGDRKRESRHRSKRRD